MPSNQLVMFRNAFIACAFLGACLQLQAQSLLGCTDPSACNFNYTATSDDGSCVYAIVNDDCEAGAIACGDGMYWNPVLQKCLLISCEGCVGDLTNDGIINTSDLLGFLTVYGTECPSGGCTDVHAVNYDPDAGFNDGSCVFSTCVSSGPVFENPFFIDGAVEQIPQSCSDEFQIDFEPYTLTALDECDGEVPVTRVIETNALPGCGQTNLVTYTATNSQGQTSTTSYTFEVIDATPPVINAYASPITVDSEIDGCLEAWDLPFVENYGVVIEAYDECENGVNLETWYSDGPVENVGYGSGCYSFTRIHTITAMDDCGNATTTTVHQPVLISDISAPQIFDLTLTMDCSGYNPSSLYNEVATQLGVSACDYLTLSENGSETSECGDSIDLFFTAVVTDACGNSAAANVVVFLQECVSTNSDCLDDWMAELPPFVDLGCQQITAEDLVNYSLVVPDASSCCTNGVVQIAGDEFADCGMTVDCPANYCSNSQPVIELSGLQGLGWGSNELVLADGASALLNIGESTSSITGIDPYSYRIHGSISELFAPELSLELFFNRYIFEDQAWGELIPLVSYVEISGVGRLVITQMDSFGTAPFPVQPATGDIFGSHFQWSCLKDGVVFSGTGVFRLPTAENVLVWCADLCCEPFLACSTPVIHTAKFDGVSGHTLKHTSISYSDTTPPTIQLDAPPVEVSLDLNGQGAGGVDLDNLDIPYELSVQDNCASSSDIIYTVEIEDVGPFNFGNGEYLFIRRYNIEAIDWGGNCAIYPNVATAEFDQQIVITDIGN